MNKSKVLLINWDNYPNNSVGGVYAWEKILVDSLTDFEFVVANIVSNPNVSGTYKIPPHVTKVIEVPLFGSFRSEEFHQEKGLFSRIMRTTPYTINNLFIPLYEAFLQNLFSRRCDYKSLSEAIFQMHDLFSRVDVRRCIENPLTWDKYIELLSSDNLFRNVTMNDARFVFQIVQRIIQILSIKIPKVDLVHCSLAWVPSIIAIIAKTESNCPVIVTEHGVAFRDLALYHSTYFSNGASSILWKVFSSNILRAVYSIADVITPVCYANAVWEENLGAAKSKIRVLYNGIDTEKFRPLDNYLPDNEQSMTDSKNDQPRAPTIVYVGRVEVLKDVMNLIQSMKYVQERIPDVQCLIYGISTDLDYSLLCLDTVAKLGLENNIKFMGKTTQVEKVYNIADVIVLSSIAEGFPYSIIEAMACRRAIVATDVGGIREALEGCGLLVRSRHPIELGNAIVTLLKNRNLREELAAAAFKRVHDKFKVDQCISTYRNEYIYWINAYKKSAEGAISSLLLKGM